MNRLLRSVPLVLNCLGAALAGTGVQAADPAQAEQEFQDRVRPVLKQYCVMCHNAKLKTAGVALDGLDSAATLAGEGGLWERVLRKVRSGEMPPQGLPKPTQERSDAMLAWVSTALDREAESHPDPGRVTAHRLNRAEYNNAIRDLLAIDFQPADSFPADDSGYGFDNVADVLSLPPMLMEKYLAAASKVAKMALGRVHYEPVLQRVNVAHDLFAAKPWRTQGAIQWRVAMRSEYTFPVDAEYVLRVRLRGVPSGPTKETLEFRIDDQIVHTSPVEMQSVGNDEISRSREFRLPVKAGSHKLQARFVVPVSSPTGTDAGQPPALTKDAIAVDWVEIGGPYGIKRKDELESRRVVLACTTRGQDSCASEILTRLARRAWRRPVTPVETQRLVKFYRMGVSGTHDYESGIELGLKAILVSPYFLFRVERDRPGVAPGEAAPVSDLELASRLSFFLWSSIPDEELLALAEHGQLREPGVIGAQVQRMLANPKSAALTENFAGQWLHLRNLASWHPEEKLFPEVDDSLRIAARREVELFFQSVLRENRSVLDFLDSKDTFLNERLARYYGIEGVQGAEFRRVELAGAQRGGVLTMAGVLAVTSYPMRTSPVIRGKWVLENLLGAPPPPPPPDVPALKESAIGKTVSMRQQMEAHRSNPVCAACHAKMDPIGFALENYDAAGRWRTKEGGFSIDASGKLPSGQTFTNAAELKQIMRSHPQEFVLCFTEKLMTYALGRGVERTDKPVVRGIVRNSEAGDYRFTSILNGIVESAPFQMRRTSGTTGKEGTHVAD